MSLEPTSFTVIIFILLAAGAISIIRKYFQEIGAITVIGIILFITYNYYQNNSANINGNLSLIAQKAQQAQLKVQQALTQQALTQQAKPAQPNPNPIQIQGKSPAQTQTQTIQPRPIQWTTPNPIQWTTPKETETDPKETIVNPLKLPAAFQKYLQKAPKLNATSATNLHQATGQNLTGWEKGTTPACNKQNPIPAADIDIKLNITCKQGCSYTISQDKTWGIPTGETCKPTYRFRIQ